MMFQILLRFVLCALILFSINLQNSFSQVVSIDSSSIQHIETLDCLNKLNLKRTKIDTTTLQNIKVTPLCSDDRASAFLIWIKDTVRAHYHADHTEIVYVLEGSGKMYLADRSFSIQPGDYLFIPKGNQHAVKTSSARPLKVISVQTPRFKGKDRIYVDE